MFRSARTARTGIVVAGAAAGALLLAACAPTTTTQPYSASDGVNTSVAPDLRGLNLLVVSEGDGAEGALQGALANSSSEDVVFVLEAQGSPAVEFPVPAQGTVYLGGEEGIEAILPTVDTIPGGTLEASLSVDDATSDFYLPVFDGTQPDYAPYLP